MEEIKKYKFIPIIMFIITIIVFLVTEKIVRRILISIQLVLLVIYAVKCVKYVREQIRGNNND